MEFKELAFLTDKFSKSIKDCYGIDLEWGEKAGLKTYLKEFEIAEKCSRIGKDPFESTAVYCFMKDYFGLDYFELIRRIPMPNGCHNSLTKIFGLGFIDTGVYISDPRFKKYCQNHAQQWRDERNLI
jgi:hypothetical protein